MAMYSEFSYKSTNGETDIHVNKWTPEGEPIGILQIVHGVAEYGFRYDKFARFMAGKGFVVYADDHLGHGSSIIKDSPRLYFGEENGWFTVVSDLKKLTDLAKSENNCLPFIIFGHSMGSFLTRSYLIKYPNATDGAIICGTGHMPKLTILGGKIIANHYIKKLGKKGYSKLADDLAFGAYNKKFAPNRTPSDWVSLSEENVDSYLADQLCGGKTSLGLFSDLIVGMDFITSQKNINKMNKETPILFVSGEEDPVGDMGKGVKKAVSCFEKAGVKNVSLILYPKLRHEILNEECGENIMKDIYNWICSNIFIEN